MASRRRKIRALLTMAVSRDKGTAIAKNPDDAFFDQLDRIVQGMGVVPDQEKRAVGEECAFGDERLILVAGGRYDLAPSFRWCAWRNLPRQLRAIGACSR